MMDYGLLSLICSYSALGAVIVANIIVIPIFVITVRDAVKSKITERKGVKDMGITKQITELKQRIAKLQRKHPERRDKTIKVKIVLYGVDELRNQIAGARQEVEALKSSIQSLGNNIGLLDQALGMEFCEPRKSKKEVGQDDKSI